MPVPASASSSSGCRLLGHRLDQRVLVRAPSTAPPAARPRRAPGSPPRAVSRGSRPSVSHSTRGVDPVLRPRRFPHGSRCSAAKRAHGLAWCCPRARCADTVGAVVERIAGARTGWWTRSWWWTAARPTAPREVAAAAGAQVVPEAELMPELGPGAGQGRRHVARAGRGHAATWWPSSTPTRATSTPRFVNGLVGPAADRPRAAVREGHVPAPVQGRRRSSCPAAAGASAS